MNCHEPISGQRPMPSTSRNRGRPIRLRYIPLDREDRERMKAFLESIQGRRRATSEDEDDEDG